MGQYLPIIVLMALAIIFGALSSVASMLLAPRRPNSAKSAPYECGIVPSREAPERFPVSFYIIAMLFIMFDIEIIFAYPYAVSRQALGSYAFFEMLAFSAVFSSHLCMPSRAVRSTGAQYRKRSDLIWAIMMR